MIKARDFLCGVTTAVLFCLHCAIDNNIAGGGTVVTNGTIMGTIVTETGVTVKNARVSLISSNFNPYNESPEQHPLTQFTDENGEYVFKNVDTGHYNIQAVEMYSGTTLLRTRVQVVTENCDIGFDTLSRPGAVRVIVPDTIDTAGRYVYIKGTTIWADFSGKIAMSGNTWSIVLGSVPQTTIPAILLGKNEQGSAPVTIADSAIVTSSDTTTLGIVDTSIKPLWRFSCIVGVTAQTVALFKGLDSIKIKIRDQINTAERKFNGTTHFNGELDYSIDSIYQFSADPLAEIKSPLVGFDYRLIYNAYAGLDVGYYTPATRTSYMVWLTDGMFGQNGSDVLTWHLGEMRGCLGLKWLTVKAEDNPVNHQAFTSEKSIMNWPYGENAWDAFNINVINYTANKVLCSDTLLHTFFPASAGLIVKSATGELVKGATVTIYGVRWNTFQVDTPAVLSGATNMNGEYVFAGNPFDPDSDNMVEYLNLLITAVNADDTTYNWMPINEVGKVWFSDPDSAYRLLLHF